jgi:hypothetical protein
VTRYTLIYRSSSLSIGSVVGTRQPVRLAGELEADD